MMANHTGVVALVLLVVASMVVAKDAPKEPEDIPLTPLTRVSFKRIADIETNGLLPIETPSPKKTESRKQKLRDVTTNPSAVPSLKTIANIITFIQKSIDQIKEENQKLFYIGRGSYAIEAKHVNSETAVRTAQITALTHRYDQTKIEAFDSVVKKYQKTEMVLLYDTVIDPNEKITTSDWKKEDHVRSHATLEALMLHIFCGKPPSCKGQGENCVYFPAGSHTNFPAGTTYDNILSFVKFRKDDHGKYANPNKKYCVNSNAGTINGGLAALRNNTKKEQQEEVTKKERNSKRNRGVLYLVSFDRDTK